MNNTAQHQIMPTDPALNGLGALNNYSLNDSAAQLFTKSVAAGECQVSDSGALVATTGEHTGRSPKDKFIVHDGKTETTVWWQNSQAMSPEHFSQLKQDFLSHAQKQMRRRHRP